MTPPKRACPSARAGLASQKNALLPSLPEPHIRASLAQGFVQLTARAGQYGWMGTPRGEPHPHAGRVTRRHPTPQPTAIAPRFDLPRFQPSSHVSASPGFQLKPNSDQSYQWFHRCFASLHKSRHPDAQHRRTCSNVRTLSKPCASRTHPTPKPTFFTPSKTRRQRSNLTRYAVLLTLANNPFTLCKR